MKAEKGLEWLIPNANCRAAHALRGRDNPFDTAVPQGVDRSFENYESPTAKCQTLTA